MKDFASPFGSLALSRVPAEGRHSPLQAWDAADELLLEQIAERRLPQGARVLVVNDQFGALAVSLVKAGFEVLSWSDSFLSQQASLHNLAHNQLDTSQVSFLPSTQTPAGDFALALYRIPRTLAFLAEQLSTLRQQLLGQHTELIAGAMLKQLNRSVFAHLGNHFGPFQAQLARKKARLINAQPSPTISETNEQALTVCHWVEPYQLWLSDGSNVFSRGKLDIGTRAMLDALAHLPKGERRGVDIGCGNGALGLYALKQGLAQQICFVDESYQALSSARQAIEKNGLDAQSQHFIPSNALSELNGQRFELALCNPPFHQQNTLSNQVAEQMIQDAAHRLERGGELWLVGNRHLAYAKRLQRHFGNCRTVSKTAKFDVLRALKR